MKNTKMITLMLAACSVLAVSPFSVSAASADQSTTDAIGTEWTYELKNDPTYTVTIPSAVELSKDGTEVEIVAENIANLNGQRVSVTIAETDGFRDQMVLEGEDENGKRKSIRYSITTESGEYIETNASTGATCVGKELASFTEDGTSTFTVAPIINSLSAKGVTYTGSMTYGIELVD